MVYLPNVVPTRESTQAVSRRHAISGASSVRGTEIWRGPVLSAGINCALAEEEDHGVVGEGEVLTVRRQ